MRYCGSCFPACTSVPEGDLQIVGGSEECAILCRGDVAPENGPFGEQNLGGNVEASDVTVATPLADQELLAVASLHEGSLWLGELQGIG